MRALRLVVALFVLSIAGVSLAEVTGVAPSGQKGTLHRVVKGDTLWDLTALYLGTPWIWPSVWKENEGINNPHLIYPGDLIWITENEMRRWSPEELERLMAGTPASMDRPPILATPPRPDPDPFAALDSLNPLEGPIVFYAGLNRAGFVVDEDLKAAAAVLGTHREHYWLSQTQRMIISAGEADTDVGQEFMIFRLRRRVLHPRTRKPLGYYVEVLGKAEVSELHPETSYAQITTSYSEIEPGDRLLPFERLPEEFRSRSSHQAVKGSVVAQQAHRNYSGRGDLLILDQGFDDGLETGRELEIFRPGREVYDPITEIPVLEPDDRVARVFVLRAGRHTSVALVTDAKTEIEDGDLFRSR